MPVITLQSKGQAVVGLAVLIQESPQIEFPVQLELPLPWRAMEILAPPNDYLSQFTFRRLFRSRHERHLGGAEQKVAKLQQVIAC